MLLSTSSVLAAPVKIKITNYAFTPKAATVRLGRAIKWKNNSTKTHAPTPTVTWSWSGVTVAPGVLSGPVRPTQAGTFPYFCSIHPTKMKGTIKVPMTVSPTGGNTGTFFTLTLGTVKTAGVLIHDVEVRKDGGAWQIRAVTAEPTISIFFPQTGTWDIRTRLRWQLGGATSAWSPISTVVVF